MCVLISVILLQHKNSDFQTAFRHDCTDFHTHTHTHTPNLFLIVLSLFCPNRLLASLISQLETKNHVQHVSKSLIHCQKIKIYHYFKCFRMIQKKKTSEVFFSFGNQFWIIGISLPKSYIKRMFTYIQRFWQVCEFF